MNDCRLQVAFITVRHNIEVAHRLSQTPGKCENIHGHSMWVEMRINGRINPASGLLENDNSEFEFGTVKKFFRNYLDNTFDHHVVLNEKDPWANLVNVTATEGSGHLPDKLPGLTTFDGDPTTENIAKWIAAEMAKTFLTDVAVDVAETSVNKAGVMAYYDSTDKEARIL